MRVRLYILDRSKKVSPTSGNFHYWKTIKGTYNTQFFQGFSISMLQVYSDRAEIYLKKDSDGAKTK